MMLSSLNKTMNSLLNLDAESKQRMKKLHGKTIGIELLPFSFEFQCSFDENGVNLFSDELAFTDTVIRGTPLNMLGVMLSKENRQKFFAEDLIIEGNAEFGQEVVDLFDHLQIDWEEYLSKITGDVPAYHTFRLLRKFNRFMQDASGSMRSNINEYIHEEAKWLPIREALNDFFHEIDTTRMDVDRMQERIAHLEDERKA
jgi:ubiquinone biosynthesis protein UbiJ